MTETGKRAMGIRRRQRRRRILSIFSAVILVRRASLDAPPQSMEAAGIEPASKDDSVKASTSVVCLILRSAG